MHYSTARVSGKEGWREVERKGGKKGGTKGGRKRRRKGGMEGGWEKGREEAPGEGGSIGVRGEHTSVLYRQQVQCMHITGSYM